jgi:hypothetical protein
MESYSFLKFPLRFIIESFISDLSSLGNWETWAFRGGRAFKKGSKPKRKKQKRAKLLRGEKTIWFLLRKVLQG